MGGISSGPGPGICFLTLLVLLAVQQARSAPVQDDSLSTQSRPGYYDGSSSELSSGCYYNFQHYGEGDRIITNEPCLNCTCHNRMLMCYLRVCPFTKAIGQNCTIEKQPGQCCPLIICPEVPVQLLTSSTTTEHLEQPHRNQLGGFGSGYGHYGTALGHVDDYGCMINGEFYTNGAQIPGNIDKPCEVCYCIRNRTACIMQECTLQVEGCIPVYEEGLCCPVRYQCDYEYNYNAITTEQPRPTPGLVLTTTTSGPFECQHDNKWYADGSSVDTEDPCEHCYCMKGDIVCAVQECKTPFEKDGHNCTAMPPAPGKCCPDSYHCDGNEIVDESEPTFRQDRMNKFGRNNANITMSITSSTSSANEHGWHYGQGTSSNETPNRFTEEHDKDGTGKPGSGKPGSDAEGEMMVTEGVVPSSGSVESASHHFDGHGASGGAQPVEGHHDLRPLEHGETPTSQGHGVNTDDVMTISQVIHSIIQNQTNLMKLNQSMMESGKKPEESVEDGNPVDSHPTTTQFPDGYYGFTGGFSDVYGQHGRPQKKPTKPGTTDSTGQIFGEHGHSGRPQRPGTHKKPTMSGEHSAAEGVTGDYEGVTDLPDTDKFSTVNEKDGKPHRRPVRPEMTVEESTTGIYEGATGVPGSGIIYQIFYDKEGKPHKRPVRPGVASEEGMSVIHEDSTDQPESDSVYQILYDKDGKPHRYPVRPEMTEEESTTGMFEGATEVPGSGVVYQIFYDKDGKPHRRPITSGMAGESVTGVYEDVSGLPSSGISYQIYYDKHGKPYRRPMRPGMAAGESIEGELEGLTGTPEGVFYDEHGKPHRKPVRPGTEGEEGVTGVYEGVTGQPETDKVYQIFYDKDGKPHRRPVKPTDPESVTGEYGSITGQPGSSEVQTQYVEPHKRPIRPGMAGDGESGKPVYQIFFDSHGKPHRRPVRPGSGVMTGENGMPVGVTGVPEETTGRPGSDDELTIYGEHGHTGRPYIRPVVQKRPEMTEDGSVTEYSEGATAKPGMDVIYDENVKGPLATTDEDGNVIEGVTQAGEGYTGQPGLHTVSGEHGNPQKRPVIHKKPGMVVEENPLGGTAETSEGHTAGPESDGSYIYYDGDGRPHIRPVTHKPGVMTDEVSSGLDQVTGGLEPSTEKPDDYGTHIVYDEFGRPQKRPAIHKQPGSDVAGVSVDTATSMPEDRTKIPESEGFEIFYDKFGRPHRRPIMQTVSGVSAEGSSEKPEDGQQVTYDQYGSPVKKPVVHGPAEGDEHYDEYGRPYVKPITRPGPEGVSVHDTVSLGGDYGTTEVPEGQTITQELFGEHGRPYKRPVLQKIPESVGTEVYEGATESTEENTGKPGTDDEPIIFGEHGHLGRPHKRPVSHKPVSPVTTGEQGRPIVSEDTETQTGIPETDGTHIHTPDEHGKPTQAEKDKPEVHHHIVYDAYGRPHRKPVVQKHPGQQVLTDEEGNPIELITESPDSLTTDEHGLLVSTSELEHKPDGQTGENETSSEGEVEDHTNFPAVDEHGHPVAKPDHTKPEEKPAGTEQPVTGESDKPEDISYQIVYDQFGRPHKRPIVHGKPGETPMTDEHGKPMEAVTPEYHTDVPEVDEQGQTIKTSQTPAAEDDAEHPAGAPETDEHGHPVMKPEVATEIEQPITGESDKPADLEYQIVYDQYGRPHKRPVVHGKPGETSFTDELGSPVEGVTSEGYTVIPEVHKDSQSSEAAELMTEAPEGLASSSPSEGSQQHTDKRPVVQKPGSPTSVHDHGLSVESYSPEEHPQVDEHGHPVKASPKPTEGTEEHTGEHDYPVFENEPGNEDVTGTQEHLMTESPEAHVEKPESDSMLGIFGEHGHPQKRPSKPGSVVTTEIPGEGQTRVPGTHLFDEHGRPLKRPGDQQKPGDTNTVYEDGHNFGGGSDEKPGDITGTPAHEESMVKPAGQQQQTEEGSGLQPETTESPEDSTSYAMIGESGRPHKKPVFHKHPQIPSEDSSTEAPVSILDGYGQSQQKPVVTDEDAVTGVSIDHTGKPEIDMTDVFHDKFGKPHKKPVIHKQPSEDGTPVEQSGVPETDEHGHPVGQKPEEATGDDHKEPMKGHKPDDVVNQIVYDQYGRPQNGKPGEPTGTDEHVNLNTESPEEQTARPGSYDSAVTEQNPAASNDEYPQEHTSKPPATGDGENDRPVIQAENHEGQPSIGHDEKQKKPIVTYEDGGPIGGVTGSPEHSTDVTESDGKHVLYNKQGHRKPVVQKHPGQQVLTDEEGNPIELITESPDSLTTDEHGLLVSTSELEHKPDGQTGENETSSEGEVEDHTNFPAVDEHGHPVAKPDHTKPEEKPAGTEQPVTGESDKSEDISYQIVYDQFGRPHKRPIVHGKPGETPMTDEHGKPMEAVTPEYHTDVPEVDEQGQTIKTSQTPAAEDDAEHPAGAPETDEHGHPVTKPGETKPQEEPETEQTATGEGDKPEDVAQQILYDKYGRPHKRPIIYGKPAHDHTDISEIDEFGQPVKVSQESEQGEMEHTTVPEADESGHPLKASELEKPPGEEKQPSDLTTDSSVEQTKKPGNEDLQISYDEHGKPIDQNEQNAVATYDQNQPVEGMTAAPGTDDMNGDGTPVAGHRPIVDEHGQPLEGVTALLGGTGKPDEHVIYDEQGRPTLHGQPDARPTTEKQGTSLDDSLVIPESTAATSEDLYGQHGYTGRPEMKPQHPTLGPVGIKVTTDEAGNIIEVQEHSSETEDIDDDQQGVTEHPQSSAGSPGGADEHVTSGEHGHAGQPHKRPVAHSPGSVASTDEHGIPVGSGVLEDHTPDDHGNSDEASEKPATADEENTTDKVETDEHGHHVTKPYRPKPQEEESAATELPMSGESDKPEDVIHEIVYDKFGRPHKRPVVHGKPGETPMTDEHGKPMEGVTSEDHTDVPEVDEHSHPVESSHKPTAISETDKHGLPIEPAQSRPDEHETGLEITESTMQHPQKPESDSHQLDHQGQPVTEQQPEDLSKPEHDKPVEGEPLGTVDHVGQSIDHPELGHIGKPPGSASVVGHPDSEGTDHGHPVQTTDEHGKPTEAEKDIPYDLPHGKPVVHKHPVSPVFTDEEGSPIEAVTESSDSQIEEHGRPLHTPELHHKPDDQVMTEEPEVPTEKDVAEHATKPEDVEGHPVGKPEEKPAGTEQPVTGESDKPEDISYQIVYDQFGRPHKRPIVHGKPGETPMTDEHGKPMEAVTPEYHTDVPEVDEQGQTIKTSQTPAAEDDAEHPAGAPETDEHGHPVMKPEVATEIEQPITGESDKPADLEYQIVYDQYGRPHKRPIGKPVEEVIPEVQTEVTEIDEHGHPIRASPKPTVEGEENTDMPDPGQPSDIVIHKKPEVDGMPQEEEGQSAPEESPMEHPVKPESDEHHSPTDYEKDQVQQKPVSESSPVEIGTGVDDEKSSSTEAVQHSDELSRPYKKPAQKITESAVEVMAATETPEGHTGRPESDDELAIFGESGRPHKRPQKPGIQDTVEDGVRPVVHKGPEYDDGVTESPEDVILGADGEDAHTTERPVVQPEQKPESDDHSESQGVPTGIPGAEVHDDETESQKKPEPTEAENEVSEDVQPTQPIIFGEHGHGGRPQKRPGEGGATHEAEELPEGSSPDVHYGEGGRPKPEMDSEGSDVVTEPSLYDEHGEPQRKPGENIDESDTLTSKPEGNTSRKPETSETIDQHARPEENEIGTSDRLPDLSGQHEEHFPGKPGEQEKEPEVNQAGRPESSSAAPGGLWQYLPPKSPEHGSDEIETEGTVSPAPGEDDDESLIVTTDESGEEYTERPGGHHEKKPEDVTGNDGMKESDPQVGEAMTTSPTSPKPEDAASSGIKVGDDGKPVMPVPESTPGLGSSHQDITTPGYNAHEISGAPVTDTAQMTPEVHFDTHEPVGIPVVDDITTVHATEGITKVPGVSMVFDKDGKPHVVPGPGTGPSGQEEITSPSHHEVTGKPDGEAVEGITRLPGIVYDADGKPHVTSGQDIKHEYTHGPESKPHPVVPDSLDKTPEPEHKPTETDHAVFGEDGKPQPVEGEMEPEHIMPGAGEKLPVLVDGITDSSSVSPFDAVLNNLANVLRPGQSTTVEPTGATDVHAEVPGEGSCYMDGIVYENNSEVPPLSPCHTKCNCFNSIIHCLSLKCPSPPEDVSQCTAVHDENSCCPTYICGNDVFTTTAVEGEETTTPASILDSDGLIAPIKPVRGSSTLKPEADDAYHGEQHPQQIGSEDSTGSTPSTSSHPTDDAHKPQVDVHTGPPVDSVTDEASGMQVPTEEGQLPMGVHLVQPDQRPIESDKPAHVAPPRPSGYFPVSSDAEHPSTALPSYFGTGKPFLTGDHQKPESGDLLHGAEEPEKDVGSTQKPLDEEVHPSSARPESDDHHKPEEDTAVQATHKPAPQGSQEPESSPDQKKPETDEVSSHVLTETKKPSEIAKPEEAEAPEHHQPESDKPEDTIRPVVDSTDPMKLHVKPDGTQHELEETDIHEDGKPDQPHQPTSTEQVGQDHGKPTGLENPHETSDDNSEKPEEASKVPAGFESHPTTARPVTDSDKPAEEQGAHIEHPLPMLTEVPGEETYTKKPVDQSGELETEIEHDESSTEKGHSKPDDTSDIGEESQNMSRPTGAEIPQEQMETEKKPQEELEVSSTEESHPSTEATESEEQKKPTSAGEEPGPAMTGSSDGTPEEGSFPSTHGTTPNAEETEIHVMPETETDKTSLDIESESSSSPLEEPKKPEEHSQHGEEHPSQSPETVLIHSKPDDSASSFKPHPEGTTPGIQDVAGHKPQTEEPVPIEALLHPTRMPGTYQTQRPEMEPVNEFDEDSYQKPDIADEIMATIFPDLIRPITKRPMRPGTQGTKHPVKPEEPLHKPEEGTTAKPSQESTPSIPIDLSEIFNQRPSTSTQMPDKYKPGFGDFQPGTTTFQKPEGTRPHDETSTTTPHSVFAPVSTTEAPGFAPEEGKPSDIEDIQYVLANGEDIPEVPEGATLGELVIRPDGQKYWPLIFFKKTSTTARPSRPVPQQVFNGTHFIQYIPYGDGEKPEIPQEATLGQPQKGPDGEIYWPIIDTKPVTSVPESGGTTPDPYQAGQVYNGTHFIQFVPYKEGGKPQVPAEASLGEPETASDGQKYWPIISTKPIPEDEPTTTAPVSQPEQIFNGTHFIQYVPFNNGEEPEVPEDATLGQPQKGPDGQIYWPVINRRPIPEAATQKPAQPVQVFNGTNLIQYVPFTDGEAPEVPEGATLGQPQKTPDGQIYWPIIYMKPQPVTPVSGQGQVYNGTNFIQYVPYKEGEKPQVPEDATLGQPQKTPDGQIFWPLIYMKPVSKPTTEAPSQVQLFNGTHFIQYVPFTESFEPELPEGATLGKPEKRPDGQLYWPVIYEKLPSTPKPEYEQIYPGQAFNGTHFIQYIPYRPSHRPQVPEGVVLGQPEKGHDGNLYWTVVSTKPLPDLQTSAPVEPQVFNGTHYIQYVPFKDGEKPKIPEGATLGKPQAGPEGQKYWPIIYLKPQPGVPITYQRPETPAFDPASAQIFNGTHYIQYVPYVPGQRPEVPEGAMLGHPTRGPNGQRYWPIIYLRPSSGMLDNAQHTPIVEDEIYSTEGQVYNGSHYIQYVPYKPGQKPIVPQDATLGHLTKGPNGQLYWPIIHLRPIPGVPVSYQKPSGFDPSKAQVFNGTHYIQYVPYIPGQRPVVPEGATLGHPTKGANNQMYWPIVYLRPAPSIPIATEHDSLFDPTKAQSFNGTHYIQYLPYIPGQRPEVPEGAILGHPTRGPGSQMYWPLIYLRPVPGVPVTQQAFWSPYDYSKPRPEQAYNGTHFILYVPYNPTLMPEVPEGATLGHPQKGPDGQMYWVIISDKPIPTQTFNGTHAVQYVTPMTPEQDKPVESDHRPIQVFNGTHYIQYVPYKSGQKPVVPEGATLGQPTKGPEGQIYWPIVYVKPKPTTADSMFLVPEHDHPIPQNGQVFNGTHFIRYVPYKPAKRPYVPEGAHLSPPQKGPDGQMYWMLVSRKPLPEPEEGPLRPSAGQIFNGTHYIQYVPYNASQMPEVPEGAVLGHPQVGPEGQLYWVIISDKPLPSQPGTQYVQYVTPITPQGSEDRVPGPMFNGTHYIQYVPYRPGQIPKVPEDAILGELQKGAGGMYWPVIYRRPPQGQVSNGTQHVQYAPANATADEHPFWSYGQYGNGSGNASKPDEGLWSYKPQNDSDASKGGSKLPTSQYGGHRPGQQHPEKPRPPEDVSYETIDEDHLIEYPSGSDYDETQEQPYGPGTCRYAGKVYVSAQQIPRDDPCDFCFCFRSDIICLQQSCPPPIPGCHEEPIQGFCCPRYECHVRMATLLNVTSTTTTTTTTLPPHFLSHAYKGAAGRTGCFVQGKAYRVGQAIPSASGPCMDCICGGDGKMKCEPKVCTPEPMVRQMMVSDKPITSDHR